jgi:hypothetical protein
LGGDLIAAAIDEEGTERAEDAEVAGRRASFD